MCLCGANGALGNLWVNYRLNCLSKTNCWKDPYHVSASVSEGFVPENVVGLWTQGACIPQVPAVRETGIQVQVPGGLSDGEYCI